MGRGAALLALILLSACDPKPQPPQALRFDDLPVSGSMADAQRAGFTNCVRDTRSIRCRREGVMLEGQGPYSAAVDLTYGDGSGGFDQLTLWDDRDQMAVHAVGEALKAKGWRTCVTGQSEDRGDQEVYTKPGARVRFSMDLSYWSKRRMRVLPERNQPLGHCW